MFLEGRGSLRTDVGLGRFRLGARLIGRRKTQHRSEPVAGFLKSLRRLQFRGALLRVRCRRRGWLRGRTLRRRVALRLRGRRLRLLLRRLLWLTLRLLLLLRWLRRREELPVLPCSFLGVVA